MADRGVGRRGDRRRRPSKRQPTAAKLMGRHGVFGKGFGPERSFPCPADRAIKADHPRFYYTPFGMSIQSPGAFASPTSSWRRDPKTAPAWPVPADAARCLVQRECRPSGVRFSRNLKVPTVGRPVGVPRRARFQVSLVKQVPDPSRIFVAWRLAAPGAPSGPGRWAHPTMGRLIGLLGVFRGSPSSCFRGRRFLPRRNPDPGLMDRVLVPW